MEAWAAVGLKGKEKEKISSYKKTFNTWYLAAVAAT